MYLVYVIICIHTCERFAVVWFCQVRVGCVRPRITAVIMTSSSGSNKHFLSHGVLFVLK